jgi:hypothetical protein
MAAGSERSETQGIEEDVGSKLLVVGIESVKFARESR